MSDTNNKKKNTNKSANYKPKSAKATSSNAKSGKVVNSKTTTNGNTKVVKAEVEKNGENIKQKIVTTKNVEDSPITNSSKFEDNTNKTEKSHFDSNSKNQTHDFTATSSKTQTTHLHKPSYPENWWLWAIIIIGSCLLAGGLATLLGGQMFNFRDHVLPAGVVPKIVFPIAWSLIYVLIGVSAFLVFLSPNQTEQTRRGDIIWFCINLFLNILWPLFFFRLDLLILSTILCALVVITAIITCYRFYYRNLAGGICYTIYTLWLMYAFYLNLAICLLNA